MPNSILPNGHRTLVTIAGVTAQFEEVSVTPPGIKGDDPIEQTNMRANNYRTFSGGALMTMSEMTLKVNYAVGAYTQLLPLIRKNRYVTITFFDGSSISLYCIITSFTPEELQTNEKPTATLVLTPSNLTTSDPPGETGPVYATVSATTTVAP
jgi:hypothetical protein